MPVKNRAFLDTNIFVYQFDQTAPTKQRKAIELIEQLVLNKQAVISSQVLQEFMNVALKKFQSTLSVTELELMMNELFKPLYAHVPDFGFYDRALKLHATSNIGFYDALIVQAALDLGCTTLYSEDLQDGQQFGAVLVKNPFV